MNFIRKKSLQSDRDLLEEQKNKLIDNLGSTEEVLAYAGKVSNSFVNSWVSIFRMDELDSVLSEIGSKISSSSHSINNKPEVLHLCTGYFQTGGHSSVIDCCLQDKSVSQLTVITNNAERESEEPELYESICLDSESSLTSRISILKGIIESVNPTYIILHIHPSDVIAISAISSLKLENCRIIFFNQSDHTFSLGYSFADSIVHFREFGHFFSQKYRDGAGNAVVALPFSSNNPNSEEKFNFFNQQRNHFQTISVGATWKFCGDGEINFFKTMSKILSKNQSILHFHVSDLTARQIIALKLRWNLGSRFKFLSLGREKTRKLIGSSDLLIDSAPVGGGMVRNDSISASTPFIHWQNRNAPIISRSSNWDERYSTIYEDEESLIRQINTLSNDSERYSQLYEEVRELRKTLIKKRSFLNEILNPEKLDSNLMVEVIHDEEYFHSLRSNRNLISLLR